MSDRILFLYVLALLFLRDGLRETVIITLTVFSAVYVVRRGWSFVKRIRVHIYLQPLEEEAIEPVKHKKVYGYKGRRQTRKQLGWSPDDFDKLPVYEEPVLLSDEQGRRSKKRSA